MRELVARDLDRVVHRGREDHLVLAGSARTEIALDRQPYIAVRDSAADGRVLDFRFGVGCAGECREHREKNDEGECVCFHGRKFLPCRFRGFFKLTQASKNRMACLGWRGRPACRATDPATHPADVSLSMSLFLRPGVFRGARNTAGGTPALPEAHRPGSSRMVHSCFIGRRGSSPGGSSI